MLQNNSQISGAGDTKAHLSRSHCDLWPTTLLAGASSFRPLGSLAPPSHHENSFMCGCRGEKGGKLHTDSYTPPLISDPHHVCSHFIGQSKAQGHGSFKGAGRVTSADVWEGRAKRLGEPPKRKGAHECSLDLISDGHLYSLFLSLFFQNIEAQKSLGPENIWGFSPTCTLLSVLDPPMVLVGLSDPRSCISIKIQSLFRF